MFYRSALALALSLATLPALAGPVSFSGWKEQKFLDRKSTRLNFSH